MSLSMTMGFSYDSRPIQTILNQIKNSTKHDGIDLRPDYQRGYIWSSDFKDKLIYSIIKNYPIGNVSLRVCVTPNKKGAMKEVVDGQQRLTTIYRFVNGEYNVQGEYSRKIIQYIIDYMGSEKDSKVDKLIKRLSTKSKLVLKYEQLPDIIKDNFKAYNLSITNITNSSDDEVAEYFRFLQNQEILRAGEIINSIPETALEKYLAMISDKDKFLQKIGFSDDRKDFDRLFYSIIGLLDKQIGFGITDKIVMNYVASCSDISLLTQQQCKKMIEQINHITTVVPDRYISSNRRCIKFLLLLSAFGYVDFTKNTEILLGTLERINNDLSAFSSAKADSVSKTYHGYSKDVIEEFRLIALISKGGHSFARVENRMKILSYYLNNRENKMEPSHIDPI